MYQLEYGVIWIKQEEFMIWELGELWKRHSEVKGSRARVGRREIYLVDWEWYVIANVILQWESWNRTDANG